MDAREAILDALRSAAPDEAPLPDLSALGVDYEDPIAKFGESLTGVGGTPLRVKDRATAQRALAELAEVKGAKRIVSLVAGVGPGTVDLEKVAEPRELEGLDLAILPGEIAVAENGAVWVDGAALRHRAVFVIAEHLVLVVEARNVVNDMHAAYARLAPLPPAYGLFISGPSKTADIEQALVIGAHGPRSCTVVVIG